MQSDFVPYQPELANTLGRKDSGRLQIFLAGKRRVHTASFGLSHFDFSSHHFHYFPQHDSGQIFAFHCQSKMSPNLIFFLSS